MFDFDSGKLLILGVVALVVIGPKELPGVLRQVGQAIGKLRRMAADFQGQFMEAMREAELDDLKKELDKVAESTKAEVKSITDAANIDTDFNPVDDLKREVGGALEGPKTPDFTANDHAVNLTVDPAALPPPLEPAPAIPHETVAAPATVEPPPVPAKPHIRAAASPLAEDAAPAAKA